MTYLKDLMKKRKNIKFFKQDVFPTKEEINNLLKDAHNLVPQKNNLYQFHIDIYGPEHASEKEQLVLNTVCGIGKQHWRPGGKHYHDFDKLKDIYGEWKKVVNSEEYSYSKWKNVEFNEQVRAPYLLVYTKKERLPTKKQIEKGFPSYIFEFQKGDKDESWLIGSGMHGFGLSLLANEKNIAAAFCKCYFFDDYNYTNILAPAKKSSHNIAFMLGLGYEDTEAKYFQQKNKPDVEEIITWK
jgi:hypothetical protein